MLLGLSTPYSRRGEVWRAYDKHHGQEGASVLVWQADSQSMNPSVDASVIEEAYASDPITAAAEYRAEFRRDVEAFLTPEAIAGVTSVGVLERPRISGVKYYGFTDPSGGSQDSFTLGIAHREGEVAVDAIREARPPFSPDQVTEGFAGLLRSYGLHWVEGDRYAGEWPREKFREHGVEYRVASRTKSDIYRALLPVVNSGRVELLDHRVLRAQLEGLERRTARSGRDTIDHTPGSKDDVANAAAGALVRAGEPPRKIVVGHFSI